MSPPVEQLFAFDMWDALDSESIALTQTSEFWSDIQIEVDRIPLESPMEEEPAFPTPPESYTDWSIETVEEEPEPKENIVHHDCMWAGACDDEVHPTMNPLNSFMRAEDLLPPAQGQSLLRRDYSPGRPDTPPTLDGDEAPQFRHNVDFANTALNMIGNSAIVASDHSYTFSRQPTHTDHLGVQTPSDSGESEEEIDVVSLSAGSPQPLAAARAGSERLERLERLPRTPSAHQRHLLQRTVARAISPRPAAVGAGAARKRLAGGPGRRRRGAPGRRGRRSNTDTDSEAESPELERRSIHNDMERQRRIGLKNLFDDLKLQIPATREKERAPKVVILREAASLCRRLRADEAEREALRRTQGRLAARLRKLRASLVQRFRAAYH